MASDMHELAIVSEAAVRETATPELVITAVRSALIDAYRREGENFPVTLGSGGMAGSTFGVKSGRLASGVIGAKIGTYWPDNPALGKPAHGSTTLLFDAMDGFPTTLINAGYLNGLRTAAADAVAVDVLARTDAEVLALIGAGGQAAFDARMVAHVRPLREIRIWSRSEGRAAALAAELADLDIPLLTTCSIEHAVRGADIVSTVTPSRSTLVESMWIADGAHISAMGADKPGKQELSTDLCCRGLRFADLVEQSYRMGEFQRIADRPDIVVEPLGAVLTGDVVGRRDTSDVTIFDSSGLAIQDIHVAVAVTRAARVQGLLEYMRF